MSQSLDELKQIIVGSDISFEDQNDLFVLLPIFPERSIEELNKIFKKSPKLLKEFNRALKARLRVLVYGKDDEWEKMEKELEEEKEKLEEEKEQEEKDCYYEEKED